MKTIDVLRQIQTEFNNGMSIELTPENRAGGYIEACEFNSDYLSVMLRGVAYHFTSDFRVDFYREMIYLYE